MVITDVRAVHRFNLGEFIPQSVLVERLCGSQTFCREKGGERGLRSPGCDVNALVDASLVDVSGPYAKNGREPWDVGHGGTAIDSTVVCGVYGRIVAHTNIHDVI